jgi:peptide/nickel transport system permease protein
MLDVLREQYILASRAKGLAERTVVYKHALKNAIIPTLTVIGITFAILVGGPVRQPRDVEQSEGWIAGGHEFKT